MTSNIFITGFLRSGTTYLEKRLNMRPGIAVSSQPLPLLFVELKRCFLEKGGVHGIRYPLGHLFQEERSCEAFQKYLETTDISAKWVRSHLEAMREYTGCGVKALLDIELILEDGSFVEWFRYLVNRSAKIIGEEGARMIGSKEVFCDEYLPYLCDKEIFSILVIRNPIKVLTSIIGDKRGGYVNRAMSPMHVIRQWRKSVALYCTLREHPYFNVVFFERFAEDPSRECTRLERWLGFPHPGQDFDAESPVLDQWGAIWRGNSSFTKSSKRLELPKRVRYTVEMLCAPEMEFVGYRREFAGRVPDKDCIRDVLSGWGCDEQDYFSELQRLEYLSEDQNPPSIREWFVTDKAFDDLRSHWNAG